MEIILPDPGAGRYWTISEDREQFTLALRSHVGAKLASEILWLDDDASEPVQAAINSAVKEILNTMKLRDLVGEYKFDRKK